MLTTASLLLIIEEKGNCKTKHLAEELGIPTEKLKEILKDLSENNLVEHDAQTGVVKLAQWLSKLNSEVENIKPTTGTIILPRSHEIKLQDVTLGNFTDKDLELNVRLASKLKEIAICNAT